METCVCRPRSPGRGCNEGCAPSPARITAGVLLPRDEIRAGIPVVLLHAGVVDRRMWGEHLAAIAGAGHRVIAMDLPGFGEAAVAQNRPRGLTSWRPWTGLPARAPRGSSRVRCGQGRCPEHRRRERR